MRVLFTGHGGKSGAWAMRGVQMAAEFTRQGHPSRAIPHATHEEVLDHDVVVLVKRAPESILHTIRQVTMPLFVYDPCDFWPQPDPEVSRISTPAEARTHFGPWFRRVGAQFVVGATEAMTNDLRPLVGDVATVYHHWDLRYGTEPQTPPIHDGPRTLGYEGHPRYLEGWRTRVERACESAGVRFETDRDHVPSADALLAVRGGHHGNWLARRWKSNVKAANAMARSLPLVAWPEAGYTETCEDGLWFTSEEELGARLRQVAEGLHCWHPRKFDICTIAARYIGLLEERLS